MSPNIVRGVPLQGRRHTFGGGGGCRGAGVLVCRGAGVHGC